MKRIGVLSGSLALIAAGLAVFLLLDGGREPSSLSPRATEAPREEPTIDAPSAPASSVRAPEPPAPDAELPPADAEEKETAAATEWRAGQVLDAGGSPVPSARIGWRKIEVAADAGGRFSFDPAVGIWELGSRSPELADVGVGLLSADGRPVVAVVVAPAAEVSGIVVDEQGTPLAAASLRFSTSVDALETFPLVLAATTSADSGHARTDDHGRFSMKRAAAVRGKLLAERDGYLDFGRWLVPGSGPIEITLRRSRNEQACLVTGIVVDAAGRRVQGARVILGGDETQSKSDGSFALNVAGSEIDYGRGRHASVFHLVAWRRGSRPAVIEGFGATLADEAARSGLLLQLGQQTASIEGRVVDADGAPQEGMLVEVADPTVMGNSSETIETLGLGMSKVLTDENGRFEVTGLLDRAYRLRAIHEASGLVVEGAPVRAGAKDVELQLPQNPWREVRGVVHSRFGTPITDVEVGVHRVVRPMAEGAFTSTSAAVRVDDEGRFVLPQVPRGGVTLLVYGPQVEWCQVEIPDGDLHHELTLTVPMLLRFRVEPLPGVDRFRILDDDGGPLRVMRYEVTSYSYYDFMPMKGEGSGVCQVADTAATIVLYRGDEELRRHPIQLRPDEITVIQP